MKTFVIIISLLLILASCEVSQKDFVPGSEFIKIYNDSDVSKKYYPSGITQTDDDEYLVVTGVKYDTVFNEYPSASLFKTDKFGKLLWTQENEWRAPAENVFNHNNEYGFIAMDGNLNAYLIFIDEESGNETEQYAMNMKMPLAFYNDNENLVVLGYDYIGNAFLVNTFSVGNFQQKNSVSFNTNELGYEKQVQAHMNKSGTQKPFFVGAWKTSSAKGYYINCYVNFSFKVIFLDNDGKTTGGDIFSFQDEAELSAVEQVGENKFIITRYYQGSNFVLPGIDVDLFNSQNFNDQTGNPLPELVYNAKVESQYLITESDTSVVFVSNTNSNAVKFFSYEMGNDSIPTTFDIDFSDKIDIDDAIVTDDKGMAVLGTVYVLGKYPRPFILKVPEENF